VILADRRDAEAQDWSASPMAPAKRRGLRDLLLD